MINNGYIILKRNYYTRFGELDIIARNKHTIHIIEVKLLKKEFIPVSLKLNYTKRKRMIQCTQIFMDHADLKQYFYQFDLITIIGDQIKHFENVFTLTDA